jgi:hypothetical protein
VHDTDNYGTDSYISSHLVCLMAAVHVIVTYHMVVKHGTTLNIISLQISCALLITIPGVAPSPLFGTGLPLGRTRAQARKVRVEPCVRRDFVS